MQFRNPLGEWPINGRGAPSRASSVEPGKDPPFTATRRTRACAPEHQPSKLRLQVRALPRSLITSRWSVARKPQTPATRQMRGRAVCRLLRDPLGGDWIASRISLLNRFIDQLLLALVQIFAGDPITRRILGSQIRVNLPRDAPLLSAGWGGVRHHVVGAGFADRQNGRAVALHDAAI